MKHLLLGTILCIMTVCGLPANSLIAVDFTLMTGDEDPYVAKILKAALEAADGDHKVTIDPFPISIPHARLISSLKRDDVSENPHVFYTGHTQEREEDLIQIDVPLTKGLLGYRVLIIKTKNTSSFKNINTVEALKKHISLGSGTHWPDTSILQHSGFTVIKGELPFLWNMLRRERFTAFPRGLNEVFAGLEHERSGSKKPAIQIEPSVLIHYHYDHFFYLSPTEYKRAAIIQQGLERIIASGKFDEIFAANPNHKKALEFLTNFKGTTYKLDNPLMSERIRSLPQSYWFQQN